MPVLVCYHGRATCAFCRVGGGGSRPKNAPQHCPACGAKLDRGVRHGRHCGRCRRRGWRALTLPFRRAS